MTNPSRAAGPGLKGSGSGKIGCHWQLQARTSSTAGQASTSATRAETAGIRALVLLALVFYLGSLVCLARAQQSTFATGCQS